MKLKNLIQTLQVSGLIPGQPAAVFAADQLEIDIRGIHYRAQDIQPGDLFVALKGLAADGHDFIPQATARGAVAVVCERVVPASVITIAVTNARQALAELAAAFYGEPSHAMTVIGITGTNGKTTTSYLVESILAAAGKKCGVIGTINYRYAGSFFDNPVTTPESLDLQRIMADMRAAGVTHVVMEVSSHALDLHRVHACAFDVGVFTNFTQDHLDYHKQMDAYWAAKRMLFSHHLPVSSGIKTPRAVLNCDDPKGRTLSAEIEYACVTTGRRPKDTIHVLESHFDLNGITAQIATPRGEMMLNAPLVGRHNLENILNAIGAAIALELPLLTIQSGIENLANVPGRLERIINPCGRFVYVDYAHTPDALENVLLALRSLTVERIITVFGCGGDRDRAKRPKMGAIAARLSDLVIVTSDNPRTEPPGQIITEILPGVQSEQRVRYSVDQLARSGFGEKGYAAEADRRAAIRLSVLASSPGDTILIAGKGHEPYQVVGREKQPFDDRHEAAAALAEQPCT
jgi:UDP-N-acetylmuramoyl-L-alanyl-D-glutamate--2,6-diaminopimelate ligase